MYKSFSQLTERVKLSLFLVLKQDPLQNAKIQSSFK